MAVSAISPSSSAISAYSSQAQDANAQNNPLAPLQQKLTASREQLSPFGRAKSSLEDLQARAEALKNLSHPPTLSDFKTLVQGFVQSFNALNSTTGVSRAVEEIRKAAEAGSSGPLSELRKLGITSGQDGAFALNQNALSDNFQRDPQGSVNAFAAVSDRVGRAIDKQLSSNGSIGQKTQNLSTASSDDTEASRAQRLEVQKSYQQRLATQLSHASSYAARNAVATYFSVATI